MHAFHRALRRHFAAAVRCGTAVLFAVTPLGGAAAEERLRLATTTSVENSGLLAYLLPSFERDCGCRVLVISVGSGQALELGRRGDVDVLITHAPADEIRFIADKFGVDRRVVMYNSFVLLGPKDDPAGVGAETEILAAFANIAAHQAAFVSRGDDSGTHKKERQIWRQVEIYAGDIDFDAHWYISAGVGMGQAIVMANELSAYVLSDRGTFLYFRDRTDLRVVQEDHPPMLNPYSVMRVNPARHSHVNAVLAGRFIDWLQSAATQARINAYHLRGENLFTAGAP